MSVITAQCLLFLPINNGLSFSTSSPIVFFFHEILESIYIILVISIARDDYKSLKILFNTKIDDPNDYDHPPITLLEKNGLHYTRALTGNATKVNEHVQEYLANQEWLSEFAPKVEKNTFNFQLQANLLLVVLSAHKGVRLWPEFARCFAERVMPFVKKIRFDGDVREKIAELMDIKETEVKQKFIEYFDMAEKRGLDKYRWTSVRSNSFKD
jgi:hypothetical protein